MRAESPIALRHRVGTPLAESWIYSLMAKISCRSWLTYRPVAPPAIVSRLGKHLLSAHFLRNYRLLACKLRQIFPT